MAQTHFPSPSGCSHCFTFPKEIPTKKSPMNQPIDLFLTCPEITQGFRRKEGWITSRVNDYVVMTVAFSDFPWKFFFFSQVEELFEKHCKLWRVNTISRLHNGAFPSLFLCVLLFRKWAICRDSQNEWEYKHLLIGQKLWGAGTWRHRVAFFLHAVIDNKIFLKIHFHNSSTYKNKDFKYGLHSYQILSLLT